MERSAARKARDEARAAGKLTYAGQVCKRGHDGRRYVARGECVACDAERAATWRRNNAARARDRARRWDVANEARRKEANRRWRAANASYKKEEARRWYLANRKSVIERSRQWAQANPVLVAEKCRRNQARRWFAAKRETLTAIEKARLLEFYEIARARRAQTGEKWEVDHIIPVSRGGRHHPDNLQLLLGTENARKGARLCA